MRFQSKLKVFVLAILLLPQLIVAQSLSNLRMRAANGDAEAQLRLSEAYRFGIMGATEQPDSANFYLKQAAARNHPDALYLLGIAHLRGLGLPLDAQKGLALIERAAEAGNLEAAEQMMQAYSEKQHYFHHYGWQLSASKAAQYARRAAERGSEQGRLFLAEAYLNGQGVDQDEGKGVALLKTAVRDNASDRAALRLADLYYRAELAQGQSLRKAYRWYHRAISLGRTPAHVSRARVGRNNTLRYLYRLANLQLMTGSLDAISAPQFKLP